MNDEGVPCIASGCSAWASDGEEREDVPRCPFCECRYCSRECAKNAAERHEEGCRRRMQLEVNFDSEELADRFGFCANWRCTRKVDPETLERCHYCQKGLFCPTATCSVQGLQEHYAKCIARKRNHVSRSMQPLYVADDAAWATLSRRVRGQQELVRTLYAECRCGEKRSGHVGVMLLVEDTLEEVCETLNRSGDGNATVYHFKTLQELLALDREAFEPVWATRLEAMRRVDDVTVTLGLVYAVQGGKLVVYCDVFGVR